MYENIVFSFFSCLCITIIVELVIGFFCGVRKKKDILLIILVNIITNPMVVFVVNLFKIFSPRYVIVILIVLEVSAFVIEGIIYKKYLKKDTNPFFLSLVANFSSYLGGKLISMI